MLVARYIMDLLTIWTLYTLNVYSILFTVVPVYIAEIAPKKLRGRLMSFNSVGLTAGLLVHKITFFCMQSIRKICTEISNLV